MSRTLELAILHADACSFSAAMAGSPEVAISRLGAGQQAFESAARMFGGNVVNQVGDSMLLAFDTAQAAFQAARHVFETTADPDLPARSPKPFDYRVGISSGRVDVRGNDLFGHCINMAARIGSLVGRNHVGIERSAWSSVQALAHGGVVKEQMLFAKPDEPMVSFFEVGIKNSQRRGAASTAQLNNAPVIVIVPQRHGDESNLSRRVHEILDAYIWSCFSYFATYGWQSARAEFTSSSGGAVNTEADYVVNCTVLAQSSGFRLFTSLSSRYLRGGTQNFMRDAGDFDSAIANAAVLASLTGSAISIGETERVSRTRNVGSHQLVAAARVAIDGFSKEQFSLGMGYLDTAQKIDPSYPLLLSTLARAYTVGWRFGWLDSNEDLLGVALDLASKALRFAPSDARCEADLGFVKLWANEPSNSAWHYERSIDALPFHPELSADAGLVFSYVGEVDKAARVLEQSLANHPVNADNRLWSLGDVFFGCRDYGNSLKWLSRMTYQTQAQRMMAANKARLGLDASEHVANVLALQPDFSVHHWVSIQPFTREEEREDFKQALLLAGLPP